MVALVLAFLYPNASPLVDYRVTDNGAGPFISFWNTGVLGPQPTPQDLANTEASAAFITWNSPAAILTRLNEAQRTVGSAAVDDNRTADYKVHRAVASVAIDEVNALRSWITSFKAEVAAAASLADLKTRVASLPNLPARTLAQAKTAIKAAIASGSVD